MDITTCERSGRTILVVGKRLDEGEDVVPAPAIEPRHMLAQLIEDLIHLKGGGQRFDEHGRLDGAERQSKRALRMNEDIVPQPRFQMAFHLGQVEIGA